MLSKTLFLAFAAVATVARAATPPGCLLGAVNQYEDPADIKSVCGNKDATSKIAKMCGDDAKAALSAYAELCNIAGVKVDTTLPSSTGSATASATGSPTGSGLNVATSASSATGGAAAVTTRTGAPPQSTGAAGKLEIGATVLFAGLGIFAAAL
ncbi:hypothetical protein B0J11DRAFT_528286 [Dendryphion nanum]|uniref:GPI anchored cell wall protein n=1 Tax=Dendryphion nanum TaxID=256645 RepID=A0A9P9DU03_9PLEO|nr:hypothetical protein B0J11DRAFT_528286 [Dendryphion nanum]